MSERIHPTWELREQMGRELMDRINSHPQEGSWREGFPATSLMLNSASHQSGVKALEMVVEDTLSACKRGAPPDIIKFALNQVIHFRKVLIDTQARSDSKTTGEITIKDLKSKLKNKLPKEQLDSLF